MEGRGVHGRLVVISGPSGAGKTSVCRALKEDPRVSFSVSATTRAPRTGEVDGVDYIFLSDEEFVRREKASAFLESAVYNGNRYGTPRDEVFRAVAEGRVILLEIEVQGTRSLRQQAVDALYVFVVPPSLEELRQRLESRGTNDPADIERRLAIAAEELEAKSLYDEVVVNDELDETITAVKRLIGLQVREDSSAAGEGE
ncbi:MAG: guanylate kinase [Planctomycetota bacterium]